MAAPRMLANDVRRPEMAYVTAKYVGMPHGWL